MRRYTRIDQGCPENDSFSAPEYPVDVYLSVWIPESVYHYWLPDSWLPAPTLEAALRCTYAWWGHSPQDDAQAPRGWSAYRMRT